MKHDEYRDYDTPYAILNSPQSRRQFLKRTGGGIIILFSVSNVWAAGGGDRDEDEEKLNFNTYLRIGDDGRVSCFVGKIEMGQGAITSLAQEIAEELDVDLEAVDMVMGDTALCPWDMGTFGSLSTRHFGPSLRAAGAEARAVLLELASEKLGEPVPKLTVSSGVVMVAGQVTKKVTYAELTKGKIIERQLDKDAIVKSHKAFKVMGKPTKRTDAREKVTGEAKYSADIRLPGMLYARILRPPSHAATRKSVDTSAVEKLPDVKLIKDGDLIAVLHETPDGAEKALGLIKAEYDVPVSEVDDKTIFEYMLSKPVEDEVEDSDGDIEAGRKMAHAIVETTYLDGYVAHSPMEPHAAIADVKGNKATIWASTQTPFRLQPQAAEVLGFSEENVRVITPFVGGGFGGKSRGLQALEAARLSKLAGKPVQVAWTRAEEFFYDTFRPAAVVKTNSGISESGELLFWDNNVYFAGSRGSDLFYHSPNHRTTIINEFKDGGEPHPFATGAWRAPANNTNTFARESQMDAMARKAKMDPVEFRMKNLKDPKMIRVLKAAVKKFGWTSAVAPSGRGFGVACGIDAGTYVTLMAEVDVDKATGKVQVKRVVCAQDMGLVVNPQGALLQIEGCINMGLGYALTEEVLFKGGQITNLNFNNYKLPRFSWVPKIEAVFIDADDQPPQGGGEPAIICMGGVVANAIHDAIGVQMLQMPMTPDRIKAALA